MAGKGCPLRGLHAKIAEWQGLPEILVLAQN
jgi:hypothetical protein